MSDANASGYPSTDVGATVDDLKYAFEAFKEANNRELAEVKSRGSADIVTREQVDRINRAVEYNQRRLDDLALKGARPSLGRNAPLSHAALAQKAAFETYVRTGAATLESKALSVATNADGGYLVPPETEAAVNRALRPLSPIRAIASVRQVSGSVFKKPFSVDGFGTGWVGEAAARPQTTTATLDALTFQTMELYAMPAATSTLLDDAAIDIDAWIASEVRDAFARQESTAFVTGDGTSKPKGFLDYTKVAQSSWAWNSLGFIATGTAGAFPAASPSDKLLDLVFAAGSGYRANGSFVMNRNTQATIRKFKDAQGLYIWQPSTQPGVAPSLLGYPVVESEDMPEIATDAYAVAFGDFLRGYLIVDRIGIRILRDPYSAKPYVLFYTTKRVGGGVQDFNAIKLLKFSA